MNRGFKKSDGSIFTNTEWFVAEITFVCDKETQDQCDNWPCSWQQLNYCDNMRGYTTYNYILQGDCAKNQNVAYPISGVKPQIGQLVLMRFRGTQDQINNIFEFFAPAEPDALLAMTAIQCSGGVFSTTFSEGCRNQ